MAPKHKDEMDAEVGFSEEPVKAEKVTAKDVEKLTTSPAAVKEAARVALAEIQDACAGGRFYNHSREWWLAQCTTVAKALE